MFFYYDFCLNKNVVFSKSHRLSNDPRIFSQQAIFLVSYLQGVKVLIKKKIVSIAETPWNIIHRRACFYATENM